MSNIDNIILVSDVLATARTGSAGALTQATYAPEGFRQPGVARWVDRSGGIAIGYPSFTLSVRPPSKASRIYKVTGKLSIPTLETTSPSTATGIEPRPTLAYTCSAVLEIMLPERSTAAERELFFAQLQSLMHSAIADSAGANGVNTASLMQDAIENFTPPF